MPAPTEVRAGDVIRVAAPDYMYGIGNLTMRVDEVHETPDMGWIRLVGVEVLWDGSDGGHRDIWARVAAVRKVSPSE